MQFISRTFQTTMALALSSLAAISFAQSAAAGEGCSVSGPQHAPLVIEEYSDFECPYCKKGFESLNEALKSYDGKVRVVFRNFPLSQIHPQSLTAAKAMSAICMQSPALGAAFEKQIFDNQDIFVQEGESFVFETAQRIGANVPQMKIDMEGDAVAKSIADDLQLAQNHNFHGTPSFMIGTESIVGARPVEEFKKLIDQQLNH